MLDRIDEIKKLAIQMRDRTSVNDGHYELLQQVSDLCDDLLSHFVDDGR